MNKIVKNASWIIICRVVQAILNLIVGMITARYLGPSNYGLITYASSIVSFVVPVVQLGLNGILVQEFVSKRENNGEILGTATVMCMASSLLGVVGVWAFTSVINRGETDTILVSVLYSISMFFQMTELIRYWYQSRLLSKYVSVVSLISRFMVSAYKIYIIISGKSIYWFASVNSLDYFIISCSLFVVYFRLGGEKLSCSGRKAKELLGKGKHFVFAGLMESIFGQTDKIMIKIMVGDAASGFYSAAITCAGMSVFVFTAIIDSFRPVIFENKDNNFKTYKKNTILLYSIIIYIALFQSIGLTVFSRPVVYLLYGLEYLPAVSILRIITWYSAFSYLGSARYIWFLAEKKEKYIWITNLIGALINVAGNWILIPMWGAVGAAIASVVTQIMTNFALNFVLKPIRENGKWLLEALNPIVLINMIAERSRRNK